ncbi:MAG: AAA family ATPase [Planctomycetaceae bacterium]|jgi:uncharacterized protein YhaN|nr:AAA family ATPase [Planctomycetaceae bacterium]
MRITSWDIQRFGLWEELAVSNLSEGLNVFYGPNEAGKTTLMQFMRAMLYGFHGERQRYVLGPFPVFHATEENGRTSVLENRRIESGAIDGTADVSAFHGVPKAVTGGKMNVLSGTEPFSLRRVFDTSKRGEEETFTINTPDGLFAGEKIFRQLTSDVDEQTFNNVFAIGLDELQQLAILEDTEAADMLYRLTIGIDRVSLLDAARALVQSRNHLIDPAGKPALIGRLVAQHAALRRDVNQSRVRLREYGELLAEHRQHERAAEQVQEELKKLQHETRLYETALLIADIWDARTAIRREIKLMGNVLPVGEDSVKSLDELRGGIVKQHELLAQIKKERGVLKTKFATLEVNEALWKFTPRLEIVLEQENWIRELEAQINVVKQEVRDIEKQFTESGEKNVGSVWIAAAGENTSAVGLSDEEYVGESRSRLSDYRIPARAVRTANRRYKKTKSLYKEYSEKNRILTEKIAAELSVRQIDDIPSALEKTGEILSHLRRRQTLQQRYEEMVQYRKELDRQNAFLVQNQSLPSWAIAAVVAGVVIFGTMMVFSLKEHNYSLFVIGLIGFAGSIAAKFYFERKNSQNLKTNQRQISMLASQMEHAKQEAAAIDSRYPAHGKSTEMRLQTAQTDLAAFEKLAPLDSQKKEIAYQTEQLDQRLKKAKRAMKLSQKKWDDWLKAVRLPDNTQPSQIRELMGHYDQVGGIQRQYHLKAEELAMRQREMEMLTGQISRVVAAAGITLPDNLAPLVLLERIRKLIDDNEHQMKERDLLQKELRKIFKQHRREKKNLDNLRQKKQELLTQFNVQHDEELRELARGYVDYLSRQDKEQQLQREIDAAVGGFCTENELSEPLETPKREHLAELLEQVKERAETLSLELHDKLETKGRLSQQITEFAQDRSAAGKQLELATLENRIAKHFSQWQVRGLATYVLEEIRSEYERQRQPETLNETSKYFAAMTEGRYTRVWTPFGEHTLFVDDFAGNSLDVSWLSRGTREQLFVAIRLALATTFERHGIRLPLVMDDVLVNYDSHRAFATAKTLLNFTREGESGRQLFLFTCHEHICRMFHALDVPVRILPPFWSDNDEKKTIRISPPPRKKEKSTEKFFDEEQQPKSETVPIETVPIEVKETEQAITSQPAPEIQIPEVIEQPQAVVEKQTANKPKRHMRKHSTKKAVKKTDSGVDKNPTSAAEEEMEYEPSELHALDAEEKGSHNPATDVTPMTSIVENDNSSEHFNQDAEKEAFHNFAVNEIPSINTETKQNTQSLSDNEKTTESYRLYHDERVFDADFFDSIDTEEEE